MTNVAIKVIIQVLSVSFSSWTFENLTLYREFSRQKPADTTPGKADARIPVDMILLMVQKSQLNHLGCKKNIYINNNGINYLSLNW